MNAIRFLQPTPASAGTNRKAASATPIQMTIRHIHRERDFGVGYGNSSGYAATRRYASNWAPPRFTLA